MRKLVVFLSIILSVFLSCQSIKKIVDDDTAYINEIVKVQDKLNAEFRNPKESPLDKKDLANFKSLDFFPIDKKYRVEAKLVLNKNPKVFELPTTTKRKPKYIKYADAYFSLDGKDFHVEIYQNQANLQSEEYKDFLFFPFNDYTNGFETYGGGRYIDLHIPKNKSKIIIDFNKAYNPYCAYSHRWSCPLIPSANHLKIKIKAGVKKFGL